MRNILSRSLAFVFFIIGTLTSCRVYHSFQEMHPATFDQEKQNRGQLKIDSISLEIVEALPNQFQLAYYTGHLWIFADYDGGVYINKGKANKMRLVNSDSFEVNLQHARLDTNFLVFLPVGYPELFCVIPNESIDTLMKETYALSWLNFFDQWQNTELEIVLLSNQYEALLSEMYDIKAKMNHLDAALLDYTKKVEEINSRIAETRNQINNKRRQIGLQPLPLDDLPVHFMALLLPASDGEGPPFELKIGYNINKDPFIEVIKKFCKDVSEKEWATNEMEGGKYMDPDLAEKIEEVSKKFENPDLEPDPVVREEIKDLKRRGFTGPKVTSGARSPLRQAHIYSEKKKTGGKVAKYLGSQHFTGEACDIKIPEGWSWGSDNHKKLRATFQKLGLSMPVSSDEVHVQLAEIPTNAQVKRLAMVRGYHKVAAKMKAAQQPIKEDILFKSGEVAEQKARLEKELADKEKMVQDASKKYENLKAILYDKLKELQSLVAEIARRLSEENKNPEPREGGNVKKQGWERPKPEPPKKEPPPKKDPPAKKEPKGRSGSGGGSWGGGSISRPWL